MTQGEIAGDQTDIEVEQIWDFTISDDGANLHKTFARWDGNCSTYEELQRRGATAQAVESLESACKQALTERAKFEPIFNAHGPESYIEVVSENGTTTPESPC